MAAMVAMASAPLPPGERRVRREADSGQLRWIARARSFDALLDLLPQSLILAIPANPLRIWHANAAARCLCTAAGPVRLLDSQLLFLYPADEAAVQDAVRRTVTLRPGAKVRVDLAADPEGGAATSLDIEAVDFGASADLPVSDLVLIEVRRQADAPPPLETLCRDFGVTRGEAATAWRLVSAGSIEQVARDTGRSIHTIRTQVKLAMMKTGTHTQASLVSLIVRRLSA